MTPHAVFHADISQGPDEGRAWKVTAEDGVALRVATWPAGGRGTVLMFPGRNEHVEKYGRVARDVAARGWSSAAIDWRGQGHSDRAPGAGDLGHVGDYAEYQSDVAALLATVREAGLPEPFVLLAHSMGGAIGLRAVSEGLPVRAAAFSAPMWGIHIATFLRPFALSFSAVGRRTGLGLREVPVGRRESYLSVTPFADNALTTDPETYAWMVAQAARDPRLALGRPTIQWLHASLTELRRLRSLPQPPVPVLIGLAGDETIVDNAATLRLVQDWPDARVETYKGARHELLMERAGIRDRFLDAAFDLFSHPVRAHAPASSG
jgi:lysophospholipase